MDRIKILSDWIAVRQKKLEGKKSLNDRTMYDALNIAQDQINRKEDFEAIYEHFDKLYFEFIPKMPIGANATKMVRDKMYSINRAFEKQQKTN